jgi:hypothetical protein
LFGGSVSIEHVRRHFEDAMSFTDRTQSVFFLFVLAIVCDMMPALPKNI